MAGFFDLQHSSNLIFLLSQPQKAKKETKNPSFNFYPKFLVSFFSLYFFLNYFFVSFSRISFSDLTEFSLIISKTFFIFSQKISCRFSERFFLRIFSQIFSLRFPENIF